MRKGKGKDKGCCNKPIIVMLASLIMLLAIALSANAVDFSCGFQTPANDGYLTTRGLINVSFAQANSHETVQINVTASSASTANSSSSLIFSLTNTTLNSGAPLFVNGSLNPITSLVLEPSNDYILNCACSNGTTTVACNSTRTGITIDRGDVPSAPTSPSPSGEQTADDISFSADVNAANSTGCTLHFKDKNPGNLVYAMTHSASTCTLTINNIPQGTYTYQVRATDGSNVSGLSTETTFNIETRTSARKKAFIATGGSVGGTASTAKTTGRSLSINPISAEAKQGIDNTVSTVTDQFKGKEGVKTGGGAVVGGVIGFFIVPGVGAIPGAIIGGIIGAVI